jgi:PKD repeat protein
MRVIRRKAIFAFLVISLFIPSIISQSEGPSAHLDISIKIADMGDIIIFNASASEQGSGNYLEFKMSYGDGSIDRWQANPVFTHSYDGYGEFEITLDVRNDAGSASLKDIVVIHPEFPIAKLTATIDGEPYYQTIEVINGVTEVGFSGEGSLDTDLSSTNLGYNFYFGDGRSTGWQNASTAKTIYNSTGTYSAYLIVRNTNDVESLQSSSIEFNVRASVFAILSADPAITADKEQTIVFDVSKSYDANPINTIIEYIIDYGDGLIEESSVPIEFNHSYATDGDFTAKLTVVNDKGESDTAVIGIKIGTAVLLTALLWGAIGGAILFFIISFFLGNEFIEEFIFMSMIGAIIGAVAGLIIYLLMVNWLFLFICIIIIAVIVFLIFVFFGDTGRGYIDTEEEQPRRYILVREHRRRLPRTPK